MVELQEIFEIKYGHSLSLNKLEEVSPNEGIAFVSRKSGDNGISAFVKKLDDTEPAPAGELTCALSGNGVLSTFVQEREYYTAFHVARLIPKHKFTTNELLYYSLCIAENRYKYSWGRQANRTIKSLKVPSIKSIPKWVNSTELLDYKRYSQPKKKNSISLDPESWKEFRYDEIFLIHKGYYNKKPKPTAKSDSTIKFIGATEKNNGITSYALLEDVLVQDKTGKKTEPTSEGKIFKANCITISNNGSVGEAFYQDEDFTCSHDVNPVYLKNHKLNKYIAMFLITLIKMEKYRWGYGRKWRPIRMPSSIIKLPVTKESIPNWKLMEDYAKQIDFSSSI